MRQQRHRRTLALNLPMFIHLRISLKKNRDGSIIITTNIIIIIVITIISSSRSH